MEQIVITPDLDICEKEQKDYLSINRNNKCKGIILAGGNATRLYPLTLCSAKSLLPLYNKPTIYYPLNTLKNLGCTEIMIICKSEFLPQFQKLLGDGDQFGLRLNYKIQDDPKGIADAFIIAEDFIGNDNVILCLGDNVFLPSIKISSNLLLSDKKEFCVFFEIKVTDASKYGVYDKKQQIIYEKPTHKKYKYAIPGLYVFDHTVCKKAKQLTPSKRNELEISDLLNKYIQNNKNYTVIRLDDIMWIDTGNFDDLLNAGNYIKSYENRTGLDTCETLFEKSY